MILFYITQHFLHRKAKYYNYLSCITLSFKLNFCQVKKSKYEPPIYPVMIIKKACSLLIAFFFVTIQSCGVYSLSGASIPDEMKTVSVRFFENNASLVVPYLSQQFTTALTDRIRNQSRLNNVNTDADASFEGRITDYTITATSIQANNQTSSNRLTITINVKYKNTLKPELNFEKNFSASRDFSIATKTLQAQEQSLITDINAQLTEKIFNEAFANW